ncbi:MAG TPA: CoA transferase [Mycobacteriales bacterium]|nr:CoA transferase [Mycobacteriales bacterium]
MTAQPSGLLADVTVLDLSSVGPAARAAGWLADYGADVIKVWAPAGSGAQITPPAHAYSGGRGTRRIRLDLKSPQGREEFLRLAETADVVIESFRPGVVARLSIGYDDVKSRNPRIIYCSTSGYGQNGERSQWAGHDLNYLAVGGYLANTEPGVDGKPPIPGATVADSAAGGMHAVVAILAALVGRNATGEGTYLDVSVADGVMSLMALQIDEHLATGATSSPGSAPLGKRFACYDTYRCADSGWIAVAAIEAKFWANFCRLTGVDDCVDKQYDDTAQADIRARVASVIASKPRDEWVAILAGADTCVSPVLSPSEAATTAPTSTTGDIRQLTPLLAGQVRRASYVGPADE